MFSEQRLSPPVCRPRSAACGHFWTRGAARGKILRHCHVLFASLRQSRKLDFPECINIDGWQVNFRQKMLLLLLLPHSHALLVCSHRCRAWIRIPRRLRLRSYEASKIADRALTSSGRPRRLALCITWSFFLCAPLTMRRDATTASRRHARPAGFERGKAHSGHVTTSGDGVS